VKYDTAGGDEEDVASSPAMSARPEAGKGPRQRKRRWSPLEKASGRREVGNAATAMRVGKYVAVFF
jgi:hypothetical protein